MHADKDPIAAISTAAGRGGIGIVRLSFSGRDAEFIQALFARPSLEPRRATLLPFKDAQGAKLDDAIVLYFPAPASYTGESVIEIQAHGGPVLMKLIMRACLERCEQLGLRLAEPGEFTKRAFLNGRMDLAQAEAVSDLIDASSESAAHAAARSLSGEFSVKVREIGAQVNELRAYVEAMLDFPEEEIDHLAAGRIFSRIIDAAEALRRVMHEAKQGKVLQEGLAVALVGSPNVGKSSLLNAFAGEEIAIVTDIAGTTRDRIEHWVAVEGVPVRMIDTAGVRETSDVVESKGIERTLKAVSEADVVLRLVDASGAIADDAQVLATVMANLRKNAPLITVANKADKVDEARLEAIRSSGRLVLSVKTGLGMKALKEALLNAADMSNTTDGLFMARERHIACLRAAAGHLEAAQGMQGDFCMMELLAEELRLAGTALGDILGETTPDDLLGIIFSKFCIGK